MAATAAGEAAVATDAVQRFVLRVPREESGVAWALTDVRTGEPLATIDGALGGGVVTVEPVGGRAWRVEPWGRGWRLAAQPVDGDEPLLWYTGRALRSGGELLVAPDREYDVRSKPLKRLDLQVRDANGAELLRTRAKPGGATEIEVDVLAEPSHGADRDLLVTFVAVLTLLVWREGRHQRGHGFDGDIPLP